MSVQDGLVAQKTHCAMGTVMTHRAFGLHAEESLAAVGSEVARLEGLLSRFLPDSDVSRINRSAGIASERVSLDTYEVLSKAVQFSRDCPGCFDVTISPLVALWNIGKESFAQPDEPSIRQVLPLVNHRDLLLDPYEMTVGLSRVGQSVDLGGIGKGYAGDRILDVLRRYDVSSAYSNLGGNVVTLGSKPDGSPWCIGIRHPREENKIIGAVSVVGQTVVTSGDYERYSTDGHGKRRHHILNPTTGYPSHSGLISVSIVADKSVAADALSTILFVAGMERGLELLKRFPRTEAILVNSRLQVSVTRGLEYCFQADQGVEVAVLD